MQLPSGLPAWLASHIYKVKKWAHLFPLESSVSVIGAATTQSAPLEVPRGSSWLTSAAAAGGLPPSTCLHSLPLSHGTLLLFHVPTYPWKAVCFRELGAISAPGEGAISLIITTNWVVGMWHNSGWGYEREGVAETSRKDSLVSIIYRIGRGHVLPFLDIVLAPANPNCLASWRTGCL